MVYDTPGKWKRYPSDKPTWWMEVMLEGDTLMIRGPKDVMSTVRKMADREARGTLTEYGEDVFKKLGVVITYDKLTYFSGPKAKVLKLLRLAEKAGPGPLERMFMEE